MASNASATLDSVRSAYRRIAYLALAKEDERLQFLLGEMKDRSAVEFHGSVERNKKKSVIGQDQRFEPSCRRVPASAGG